MRITQNMILRNTLSRVNDNRDEMNDIQGRISSQKRVQKASDDPLSFSRASRFRRSFEQNKQFIKNVEDADAWISTTSISLDQLHEYALQAYDLASRGADGTADAELRAQLADSVRGLLQDSVNLGNTQYLGKSIFSGTLTNEGEPFVLTGDVVTYQGNDEHIQRRVTENQTENINTTGQDLIDTDLFGSLSRLIAGLEANDETAINTSVDEMNTVKKNLLTLSTTTASRETNLLLIKYRLNSTNEKLISYISDEEDAVLEEEVVKFKSQETAYQAALQSASQIMGMNILNYLS